MKNMEDLKQQRTVTTTETVTQKNSMTLHTLGLDQRAGACLEHLEISLQKCLRAACSGSQF